MLSYRQRLSKNKEKLFFLSSAQCCLPREAMFVLDLKSPSQSFYVLP